MPVVVFPWRPGCAHRLRALLFVRERYKARHPDWGAILGTDTTGAWSKARAVMPAVRKAPSDAVIVADADVWSDGIASAVRAVTCGAAAWAMPHRMVYRLAQDSTASFVQNDGLWGGGMEREPYEGVWGGGIVVAHRDLILEVPLDPRFEGWGGEDEAWAMALQCLAGQGWRGEDDLIHLWHPSQDKSPGKWGRPGNRELRRRYGRAGTDPQAMRSIVQEAYVALDPDQPTVHPDPALRVE